MAKKEFRRSYRFAAKTSLYLSLVLSLLNFGCLLFLGHVDLSLILWFFVACYILSFLIIQYRVEQFIYKKIQQIYDNVSLLESTTIRPEQMTNDMATLSREVEKFAEGKKLEIEELRGREAYRKEFMGNVAHELKTPLFTVQGYILTLLDGAMEDPNVKVKYLERAEKGVERLIYIVRDLDMITKLETGDLHLQMEDFDLMEMFQSVFDLLEMKAAKKDISLTFADRYTATMVHGDKERIQQVLTNLVVNSIKYGKQGGTTEVSLENGPKNKILVRISDNGEGIKQEHIPRLFERFFRVDKSGSRKEGGSGLGLSIVKHILENHNQRIQVESVYGVGSEFTFTLQRAAIVPKEAQNGKTARSFTLF